ncbi:rhodanese-like domain-containing protein [Tumebacillus permanentifrigoris]|uniref:Rhodanese-related sulfurtransferase n=1 Tax=Tumebacillus permanentifrigoris TaxID=378543 RepID=A0A316DCH4_9BACL|nr:rhodanese-like domain-containing protein [Tumebacillus permanentifrigoris]PWK14987.1 rhodanese-related sulfurtransferase [Tumebacillus permanentifrigoris]
MNWIISLIFALFIGFVVSRLLPVRGLRNLTEPEIMTMLNNNQHDHEFIDVREGIEYRSGYIPGFKNIPLTQLSSRLHEIEKSRIVVLTCHRGMRSRQAARVLRKHGYPTLCHLETGVSGWRGLLVK